MNAFNWLRSKNPYLYLWQGQDFYDLPYERKGLALLVNIYNFDEYILKDNESHDPSEPSLYRTGANNDSTYMKALWKQLGYSIFNETENDEKQGKWYKQVCELN